MGYVLIVEDHSGLRRMFRMALKGLGVRVAEAENGREALDRMARDGPPSLILLDWRMPVMDGKEFLEKKAASPGLAHVPVVVCAGETEGRRLEGAAAVLTKPISVDCLYETVRCFAKPGARAA